MFLTWRDNAVVQIFFSRHPKSSSGFFFPQCCQLKMFTMFQAPLNQRPPKSNFFFFKPVSAHLSVPLRTISVTRKCNFSRNLIFFFPSNFFDFILAEKKLLFICLFIEAKRQKVPPQNTFICSCDDAKVLHKSLTNKVGDRQTFRENRPLQFPCNFESILFFFLSAGCGCCRLKPCGPTWLFPPAASHIIIIYRKAAAELCDTTDRTQSSNDRRPPSTS